MIATLPIQTVLPDILAALRTHSSLIVQAAPGAGKTTVVPLALMDETWLAGRQIIMLEPRRLAARHAASRMAQLLDEPIGRRIGYIVRNDRRVSSATRIVVVTEGVLTRMLQHDPALESAGLVIFDEFHERSLHADLGLALLLQSRSLLRPDLKLLVMSATLDTLPLAEVLEEASVITSEGRSYPVEEIHLDPSVPSPLPPQIPSVAARTVVRALDETDGNILVFLPGSREIRAVAAELGKLPAVRNGTVSIAMLFGEMDRRAQDRAIAPPISCVRKVVLATNIAETSLTIEGITVVVDSGYARTAQFHPGSGMQRLVTRLVSRDSAIQRAGRAGRLAPGRCYRLWTRERELALPDRRTPEILAGDLAVLALELAGWGADASELAWLDPPPPHALDGAQKLLARLGAIDEAGAITEHGRQILTLGLHPRLAHMVLRGIRAGWGREAVLLASLLEEKEILTDSRNSDLALRLTVVGSPETGRPGINEERCALIRDHAARLACRLGLPACDEPPSVAATGILVAMAYPDRVGRLRDAKSNRYLLANGKGALLPQDGTQSATPYLAVANLDAAGCDAAIHTAAPVTYDELAAHLPELIGKERIVRYNDATQSVEIRNIQTFGALTLGEYPASDTTPDEIAAALTDMIAERGIALLPWPDGATVLRRRVAFLHDLAQRSTAVNARILALDLPDLSDEALRADIRTWLTPHLTGMSSLKECQTLDLEAILSGMLTWEQRQTVDRMAPAFLTVPSGSSIAIDYRDPSSPMLSVRIQEIFGLTRTPTVGDGLIPLVVEMLSPARRPIQVTRDLAGFWAGSYRDVQKELKGRYPKHYWPDDPAAAQATTRTKKFMDIGP